MSGPSSPDKCEPNLTPLLDLVLQMVMFFMLTANFDKFQKNAAVKLPKAAQAMAPDKTIDVQLLVEMSSPKKGEPADPSRPPGVGKWSLSTGAGPRTINGPTDLFEKLKAEAEKHGIGKYADPNAEQGRRKTKVAVILRVDKDVPFKQLYEAMLKINQAGFEDVQLRAVKG
jgi:biopolymer transport protein ExbD